MRRVLIVGIVVVIIAVAAAYVAIPSLISKPVPSACNGGVYNAKATLIGTDELGMQLYNLSYSRNGVQQNGLYYSFTSGALAWIKANTSPNATLLNWWDYGKEIIGCAGRNSVISNPSAQFVALGFAKSTGELDSNQSLVDVGTALFTTNATLSRSIVSKYGAGYVFITTEDGGEKAPYILKLLGINSTTYLTPSGTTFNPKDWTNLGQETVIYRLLSGASMSGFSLVYSDSYVRIFSVS
jgi:hypothetical protein